MFRSSLELLPLLSFVILGFKSVLIDIREHRLPNRLSLQITGLVLSSELLISLESRSWSVWLPTVKCCLLLTTIYLTLFLISKNGLGFGDVKFAVPCGLVIGWYSPNQWLTCIWISFISAALFSVFLRTKHLVTLRTAIAFGPFMYLGVVIVSGQAILSG